MSEMNSMVDQKDTVQGVPTTLAVAVKATLAVAVAANEDSFLTRPLCREDLPKLPQVYRLLSIDREALSVKEYRMTAVIFHEEASLRVTWTVRQPDTRLRPGKLVEVRWTAGTPRSEDGAIVISRLVMLEHHRRDLDIFKTVPTSWVKDRALANRASMLWKGLIGSCQELITAVFWEGDRFERFCTGPSSCRGHHAEAGGNLRHAVETAEAALALLPQFETANASLVITLALLHDAGKCDDYVMQPGRGTKLSDWGLLVSHKPTITFWLGEVHQKLKNRLSREMLQSLLHAINATKAPRQLGLRDPMTPEAMLLSLADNASGRGDLVGAAASKDGGWGIPHRHLGNHAPYTMPQ